jgi:hypothetical protein
MTKGVVRIWSFGVLCLKQNTMPCCEFLLLASKVHFEASCGVSHPRGAVYPRGLLSGESIHFIAAVLCAAPRSHFGATTSGDQRKRISDALVVGMLHVTYTTAVSLWLVRSSSRAQFTYRGGATSIGPLLSMVETTVHDGRSSSLRCAPSPKRRLHRTP